VDLNSASANVQLVNVFARHVDRINVHLDHLGLMLPVVMT
jgi:hypothetical protein